jgi:Cysteine synthase
MARKLALYEGLFVGWSSGSAVFAALKIAQNLTSRDLVVVLLPDHGTRYLNKIYNDAWMRAQGFLERTSELTVGDVLEHKERKLPGLATVGPHDPLRKAIELMQTYEISQIPVIEDGKVYGLLTESRLLEVLMDDPHARDHPVHQYALDPPAIVLPSTPVDIVSKMLTRQMPALLVQLDHGWDIITRSDILHLLVEGSS